MRGFGMSNLPMERQLPVRTREITADVSIYFADKPELVVMYFDSENFQVTKVLKSEKELFEVLKELLADRPIRRTLNF